MQINLNEEGKKAVRELGDAINAAIENSERVSRAIEKLRQIGYEPNLSLKLEIGLYQIVESVASNDEIEAELELTDDDLRTLRSMKISLE